MRAILGSLLAICICAIFITGASASYCQERIATNQLISINGRITEIDTFNSVISVKWQGYDAINYNTTLFTIPEGMRFSKGTEIVDIFDLNIGDPVTIEYFIDNTGTAKMVKMTVSQ
ncbi:MAG: hypothetical protein ISS91_03300 [Candidatus Omnitrophica bacterium]|nr:hypothetical protein [Candidatus Omnitrophota bacterium]